MGEKNEPLKYSVWQTCLHLEEWREYDIPTYGDNAYHFWCKRSTMESIKSAFAALIYFQCVENSAVYLLIAFNFEIYFTIQTS